jgi:hypothetical protein
MQAASRPDAFARRFFSACSSNMQPTCQGNPLSAQHYVKWQLVLGIMPGINKKTKFETNQNRAVSDAIFRHGKPRIASKPDTPSAKLQLPHTGNLDYLPDTFEIRSGLGNLDIIAQRSRREFSILVTRAKRQHHVIEITQ